MTVTCNAILQKTADGKVTYSYWYGQYFDIHDEQNPRENFLTTVYTVSSLEDLERMPHRLTYEDVWPLFVANFEASSSVSVHSLTHFIVIFRRFVEEVGSPTRMIPLRITL